MKKDMDVELRLYEKKEVDTPEESDAVLKYLNEVKVCIPYILKRRVRTQIYNNISQAIKEKFATAGAVLYEDICWNFGTPADVVAACVENLSDLKNKMPISTKRYIKRTIIAALLAIIAIIALTYAAAFLDVYLTRDRELPETIVIEGEIVSGTDGPALHESDQEEFGANVVD